MTKHVMVDLETLGKGPTAAVKQIGYCFFNSSTGLVEPPQTIHVDVESCTAAGLTIDGSTVAWWFQQSPQAIQAMAKPGIFLKAALAQFALALAKYRPDCVWANSPSFDLVILGNAFDACGGPRPWVYWKERDMRTVMELFPDKYDSKIVPSVAHEAGADAEAQAKRVLRALQKREAFNTTQSQA